MGIQGHFWLTLAAYIMTMILAIVMLRVWLAHRAFKKQEAELKRIASQQVCPDADLVE